MEPLHIRYTLPKHLKFFALSVSGYLLLLSLALSIQQTLDKNFKFLFYVGILGIVIAAILILILTVWQSELIIEINSDEFIIKLPKQDVNGIISWDSVSQVGIGLSYITLASEEENYKIDFGNLKYNDLKNVKSKLLEVCESKNIPFSNI